MPSINEKKTAWLLFSTIIIVAIFFGLSEVVQSIDPTALPEFILPFWDYLVQFFANGIGIVVATVGYSLFGYLKNWFKTGYAEEFDFMQFGKTLAEFIGILSFLNALVPPPYNTIITALIILAKFVKNEVESLKQ